MDSKHNLVLAGKEDFKYNSNKLTIEPGDRLFLYTDGIVEANKLNTLSLEEGVK